MVREIRNGLWVSFFLISIFFNSFLVSINLFHFMLIGIDASRANRAQKTGVEWYSYRLIEELKKIIPGDIGVVLYSDEPLLGDLSILPPNWESKIITSPIKSPITKKGWLWTQLRLSWEMILYWPDVLFVPSHAMPLFHPRKTVITLHDIGFLKFPEAYKPLARAYHRFSSWFAAKFAWKILTPSEFTKKEIIETYKISPDKVIVTHLAPSMDLSVGNFSEEILKNYKIAKPYFLFVGRVEEKKNILGLFRAFEIFIKNNSSHNLVFAGLPGFGFEKLKKDNSRVAITGFVKDEDLPAIYKNAEVLILPSFYEGFGIPVLEAMSAGIPVICSNVTSLPEVAGDAAILINPENPEEIAGAMEKVLDPATRQALIERGFVRAKEFSWQKTAQKTWEIISKD